MTRATLLLLLLITLSAKGQVDGIDSLQKEYRLAISREKKVDILNELAFRYNKVSLEKSEETALEALELATASQYQKGIGDSYNNLGIKYAIAGQYDKGMEYFIKSLKMRESIDDLEGIGKVLNNLSGIYMYQKNYKKSIDYSTQALEIARRQDNKYTVGNALHSLGEIYNNLGDTARALNYYQQSLSVFKETNDVRKQRGVYISIAESLITHGQPQKALDACFQAMNLLDLKTDNLESSELYMVMGQIYARLGNYLTAEHYYKEAIAIADNHGAVQTQLSGRKNLSELFQKNGRPDSALYYYQDFARLNEETFSKELASRMALLEKVYDSEKKDNLLQLNDQKIKSQNSIILAISIVLLLLVVSGFVLYRFYHEKKEANIQLSNLNRVIQERNEEITAQSEELIQANEEIGRINENLEEQVNFRTDKIKEQHQKLIDYAYFNAHKVRGPLARILGLAMILKTNVAPEELNELNEKMYDSAMEMDAIIKEINKKLEAE